MEGPKLEHMQEKAFSCLMTALIQLAGIQQRLTGMLGLIIDGNTQLADVHLFSYLSCICHSGSQIESRYDFLASSFAVSRSFKGEIHREISLV